MRVMAAALVLAGCHGAASDGAEAGPASSAAAGAVPSAVVASASTSGAASPPLPTAALSDGAAAPSASSLASTLAPPPAGEALRSRIASLTADPLLRPHLSLLRDHFGPAATGPFLVQRVGRAGGASAVLVERADESSPVLLAVDRDRLDFAREHPVAGISPPALHLAITPGPEQGVALFAYVLSQRLVAARMTAGDGNPFAEIVALETPACDVLSAAYAPGWGWIVTCTSPSGTRAQHLRETLTAAWGTEGAVVGAIGPADRPALAFVDASTWTMTQRVRAVGGDRTLTFRYDADAQPVAAPAQPTPSSSTSKTSVEFGGMTGGKPRAP